MEQSSAFISFPVSLSFIPADKAEVSLSRGIRVATKAKKAGEKPDFPAYVAELPAIEAEADPVLRAAIEAGFYAIASEIVRNDASIAQFKAAGHSGNSVIIEFGEVEFSKVSADMLSLERATGRKLTADEIKAALRSLREGFYGMIAAKKECAVSSLDDSIIRRIQADLMRIETAMTSYAAPSFRPATPDDAEKHIRMLEAIGSAAAFLNVEAGECWSLIQNRISRYLESIANAPADDEESALF